MRIVLGVAVAVIGTVGLALWGASSHAKRMEAEITGSARVIVADARHGIEARVFGRDIEITGLADSDGELAGLLAALERVPGRRVVRFDGVETLALIDPYETALIKGADGNMVMSGYAPGIADAEDAAARGATGAMDLPLGSGAPEAWSRAMGAGADALSHLVEGSVALTSTTLVLSGKAATPDQAKAAATALASAPEGYEQVMSVDVLDTGVVVFDLGYEAGEGLWVFGSVPKRFDADDMAAALGIATVTGETHTTVGRFDALPDLFAALRPGLADLDRLTARAEDGRLVISAEALPGLDTGVVAARLNEALGPEVSVDVRSGVPPVDGLTRVNAATGRKEVSASGFWLPSYGFDISKPTCNAEAAALQSGRSIRFVTGSAELDAVSMAIINDIAGLLRHCTDKVGMRVVIGGHTDSQGDDNANYRLSVARATAVRDALADRGVPFGMMQAIGFGETEPVADNDTEKGRAANRRTTFTWPD